MQATKGFKLCPVNTVNTVKTVSAEMGQVDEFLDLDVGQEI